MNLLTKLERKFGRFAIPNLMYYIVILYAVGVIIQMFAPEIYIRYLMLDARNGRPQADASPGPAAAFPPVSAHGYSTL